MTEKEKMLSQQLYMASDPELVRERREAKRLTRLINDSTEDQAEYRIQLFKELFGKVGKNIWLEPPLRVDYGCNTYIGDNFFANYECIILDVGRVIIGDNVMFGPRVGLYAAGLSLIHIWEVHAFSASSMEMETGPYSKVSRSVTSPMRV